MRFVALNKPILFTFQMPDQGNLTFRVRQPGSDVSTILYFDTLYSIYMLEYTFITAGTFLLTVEKSGQTLASTQVVAGNGDLTYYFETPEQELGASIEWYVYDLSVRTQIAQGLFNELGNGFYWMQIPRTLREGSFLIKFYYPKNPALLQVWPLSFGRETGSFATLYVDDISRTNGSSNLNPCSQPISSILRL